VTGSGLGSGRLCSNQWCRDAVSRSRFRQGGMRWVGVCRSPDSTTSTRLGLYSGRLLVFGPPLQVLALVLQVFSPVLKVFDHVLHLSCKLLVLCSVGLYRIHVLFSFKA